jgi:transposase-like protein
MERDETIGSGSEETTTTTTSAMGDAGMHEFARRCTIAAKANDSAPAGVHDIARECTVSAGGGGSSDGGARLVSEPRITDRQRVAIDRLVLGRSLAAVARELCINPSTLYRWRQDEMFRVELDRRRHEVWDDAADRMRALVHPAIDVLEAEVHDEYDRSRVRAAGMILRFSDLRKSVPPRRGEESGDAGMRG